MVSGSSTTLPEYELLAGILVGKGNPASAFILHLSTAVLAREGEKNGYFSISNLSDDS
jgi:hypothetical protein